MSNVVLGLDIGGANLKAATNDRRAASKPFALWRNPKGLTEALGELVERFPEGTELAVTMTGELCDCFQTKKEGVDAIISSVRRVANLRPCRVWSTEGKFLDPQAAQEAHLKVASSNWHALATFTGAYVPRGTALLIDVGGTTTDLIPILDGEPDTLGKTDPERMENDELLYTGVRRTPICALAPHREVAAELFATTLDAYLLLGHIKENSDDVDTADGRSATRECAHARLSRMFCGDPDLILRERTLRLAESVFEVQLNRIANAAKKQSDRLRRLQLESLGTRRTLILSGSGEWLALRATENIHSTFGDIISLTDRFGPELSTCAPAYAVAILASERPR